MGIQVDVQTLAVTGGSLTLGCTFEWVNNNPTQDATITCCYSFLTQVSYTVPKATAPGPPGTCSATVRSVPTFYFSDSLCTIPGQPHLNINNPFPENAEKEVA
jgi:hypothetical protein